MKQATDREPDRGKGNEDAWKKTVSRTPRSTNDGGGEQEMIPRCCGSQADGRLIGPGHDRRDLPGDRISAHAVSCVDAQRPAAPRSAEGARKKGRSMMKRRFVWLARRWSEPLRRSRWRRTPHQSRHRIVAVRGRGRPIRSPTVAEPCQDARPAGPRRECGGAGGTLARRDAPERSGRTRAACIKSGCDTPRLSQLPSIRDGVRASGGNEVPISWSRASSGERSQGAIAYVKEHKDEVN